MGNNIDGAQMRKLANKVKKELPKDLGFCILTFETGKPGVSNYISNCDRKDMIACLRETADRIERNQDFNTPEGGIKNKCLSCGLEVDSLIWQKSNCPNCGGILLAK